MKRYLALLALVVLTSAVACGGGSDETAATTAEAGGAPEGAAAEIVDIDGIEPIREQFDADAGKNRLLLVFSPT